MERRRFLQGIFGGVTAAGLIVTAKPEEVEAFAGGLVPQQPLLVPESIAASQAELGQLVFDHKGRVIGVIQRVECSVQSVSYQVLACGAVTIPVKGIRY